MQPEQQQRYQDDDTSFAEAASSDKESSLSFPQQLMEVLSDDRLSDIISWLPHGQGWIIHDKKRFAVEVLPVYFEKKSKWTSFTRKLNRWNFTRVTRGEEVGAYYHPLFKRENKDLCLQMTCLGSKMAQNLEPLNPVALGLATPKMIEHGLLSGMAPRRGSHGAGKKKAANPSQKQSIAPPSSSCSPGTPSSSSLYFQQSQLHSDPRSISLPPSTSVSLQLNHPQLRNFAGISSVPSTAQTTTGYVDPQHAFMGAIGNPLTSSTYGGMVLPELRNVSTSTNARRPPSPNPLSLPFVNHATFLQPTPIPSSFTSWTQQTTNESSVFSTNHGAQPSFASTSSQPLATQHHQNMASYLEALNQRIHAASSHQQQDTLTLTPTPALSSHAGVETPSGQRTASGHHVDEQGLLQQVGGGRGGQEEGASWSPDHSGQDISPSIFDTTSSSSDQGSGGHHHHHHSGGTGRPRGSSSSSPEEEMSSKMKSTAARIIRTTTTTTVDPTPPPVPTLHQQHGSSSDYGGSSNIVRSLPGSVVAMHRNSQNVLVGDGGGAGGGGVTRSSLSSSAQRTAMPHQNSNLLESILGQTRKDIHDLLQQEQGGGEALTSRSTIQSIIQGNQQHDPTADEKPK